MKFDYINSFFSFILGGLAFLVGGFDNLLVALLVLMGCDWLTGILKALKKGKFSAIVGLWGIVNKVVALIVVIAINFVQTGAAINLPLRETVLVMLLINEALSTLANASTFVKGLEPLTKYFEDMRLKTLKVFSIDGGKKEVN